jgi:hypothetical protein
MKKQYSILSVFAALLISFSAIAGNAKYNLGSSDLKMPNLKPQKSIQSIQKVSVVKGITEGGFFLHYNPYSPSKKYGYLKSGVSIKINDVSVNQADVEMYRAEAMGLGQFSWGHGLEIGNMFRLTDFEPMAIGLKVTWVDFGITGFKANSKYSEYNIKGFSIDLRALKLGPYFTYAISDKMAFDVFYQVVPTFIIGGMAGEYNDGITTETVGYPVLQYGLGHEIGLTYRFDILSVGFGYGMGSMRTQFSTTYDGDDIVVEGQSYVNTFRVMLGMKF